MNTYRSGVRKNIQFSIFNCGKSKQSTATTLWWPKHNFHACKKIFKWYRFMVRYKSYDPLSNEWQKQSFAIIMKAIVRAPLVKHTLI